MSIQSEIDRINSNVQSALNAVADTGVSVPEGANSDNLPAAVSALANEKQDKLTFDATPTANSTNPVTSGGVKTELDKKASATSLGAHTGNTDNPHQVTAAQAGADPTGTAASAVSAHNSSATAHSDIRTALAGKETAGAAAAVQSNLDGHTGNTTVHITAAERTKWNGKQDKLTGTQGQVVGFDENGNAVAQNAPSGGGMTEEAADGKYLKLAGGDMSGKLTAPKIETGSGNTNYFQSRKFRGEGDAATYYHAVDFGYAKHDQVDFHEYGGIWNFFKNTSGKADGGSLCGKITTNGWEGDAKLTGSPTAPTPGTSDNSTRIATTAFVNSFNSTKLESNGDGSNVTAAFTAASSRTNISTGEKLSVIFGKIAKFFSDLKTVAFTGSYNDLSDKPTIPTAVTVDSAMSDTSTNPVQNKVIKTELDKKAASSHNQAAGTITAGTFAATDVKAMNGTDYTTARVRNIKASTTDLTAGSSSLSNGDIYLVYE